VRLFAPVRLIIVTLREKTLATEPDGLAIDVAWSTAMTILYTHWE
jgi:hypothetical protein